METVHRFILICLFIYTTGLYAQSQFYLNDQDSIAVERLRNFPNIEVGKGVSFMPLDSLYKLNLRFRMQNKASFRFSDESEVSSELMVRRLRLRFEGFVYSPKLAYVIQLGFSGADNSGLSGVGNMIRDAIIYYMPTDRWSFGFGQTKIPGNRARLNSSSALQFVDRSITNSTFNLDRDFGLFATYNNRMAGTFEYVAKAAVTSGEGRNFQLSPNAGLAYTTRLELFPLGRFKSLGDVFEGDFEREESPKLMLAAAYSTNRQAIREAGQRGSLLQNNETRDINSLFIDFIFKYGGFAFYTDYMMRMVDDPLLFSDHEIFTDQYIFAGQGINLQSSFILKSNWEFATRYSQVRADKKVENVVDYKHEEQYTAGITKYVIGHSLKFQFDVSRHVRQLVTGSDKSFWMTRFQVELGI